ncbi:hypothetical protein W97_00844 [Coniosporium apollinis CBS 100218]|uniref:Nucleoporin Nup54 alpha-helical domain-containing protein n=1 Tax=Coniosporium apollinis (strain CBS 100218) TaxID=1168221 RepID=R7YIM5_CONA1|nr:uncharacterized protein W97_00844 [Coniosporium apollinis CBS 100218]EON61629.1 hypothetical protein W97_00844 [Coniosporium apollinis CBS 100218]
MFASLNTGNTQAQPSSFGASTTTSQPQQGTSLFGSLGATQPQQQNSGHFGGSAQPSQGTGLFGSSAQPQQQQTSTLFGASQQPQQQGTSLFGGLQSQRPGTSSVFGAYQQQPQGQSVYGRSTQQWQPGMSTREKSIPEQMEIIYNKWNPESPACALTTYFYNSVRPEDVPYYGPSSGEDEKKWEEALAKKPTPNSIPVQARGFTGISHRLIVQIHAVNALQSRLHEINNSLTAMMQRHDLEISVRAQDARRRHVALSQRCLSLATKVQVLRNRGYAMDSAEEELKKKLVQLERRAFDPVLNGRQEEIWARMSAVRARAKLLQEESERLGKNLANGAEEPIDDETMKRVKQILNNYDAQLSHLNKELEQIRSEFADWETTTAVPAKGVNGVT